VQINNCPLCKAPLELIVKVVCGRGVSFQLAKILKRKLESCATLLHLQSKALAVGVEFRGVHALDVGHAGLVLAAVLDTKGVLEDVGALGEVVDVEVRGGIFGGFVVAEAVLVFVAGEDIDGFGATGAMVFHVEVFHVTVGTQFDADHEFVTDFSFSVGREEFRAFFGVLFEVDGFCEF